MGAKVYFLSFGARTFAGAVKRIKEQALSFDLFNEVFCFEESDLYKVGEGEVMQNHKDFILSNSRGFGYWLWKSYLTYTIMSKIEEDSILVYCDAGCMLNLKAKDTLIEYINKTQASQSGILSFEMEHLEKTWTKMDLFEELQCYDLLDTRQLMATCFFIKKNDNTLNLVKKWYELSSTYHLIDDSPSVIQNDVTFTDHRHDQSIFSLLRKINGTEIIFDNTYPPGNEKVPIWASRFRT
jgi:hypothetical protein